MTPAGAEARVRSFAAQLALVTALGLALRAWGIASAPVLGDDHAVGESAIQLVERAQVGPTMWQHPRVGDLAVYLSLSVLGPGKLGLVLPSLLVGVLAIAVVGLLGRELAGARAGIVAALLLALDPLHVDYSRQAVQEVYPSLLGAAGALLAVRYAGSRRAAWAIAAGVAFGVGLASKWSVGFPLAVVLAWIVARDARERAPRPDRAARVAFDVAALALLPATVYLATWLPWLLGGRDLGEWLALQLRMAEEAVGHAGFSPATLELPHRAAEWFVRPVAYAEIGFGPEGPVPFVAITNPVVWLLVLPAVALVGWRAWRERRASMALVVALFAGSWLPFALVERPIWLHSALAVLPFALIGVAAALEHVARRARAPRLVIGGYLAAASLAAVPLYLLATGHSPRYAALRSVAERYRPSAGYEGHAAPEGEAAPSGGPAAQ